MTAPAAFNGQARLILPEVQRYSYLLGTKVSLPANSCPDFTVRCAKLAP